jgi:DNA-binding SARP family transcriptional activator
MDNLTIHLLGPFEVTRRGQPLSGPGARSRQARTILKMLLLRRGQVVMMDQLLDLIWPEVDPRKARRSLQVRISQLRRLLNPDDSAAYILRQGEGYIFDPAALCWVDVEDFTRQQQQGHAARLRGDLDGAIVAYEVARGLYRGDLLESDLYEEWTLAPRERLREQYLGMLLTLAECYAQTGRYRHAINMCELVLECEPARELAYRHLMRFHYHAGEQVEALRAYERCCDVLAAELGVEPLAATEETAAQIRTRELRGGAYTYPPPAYEGCLFAVPYSLGHPPLVGRDREYAWLVERWLAGVPMLLLEGPAGVGKTRLATELLGYAAGRGATVLQASAAGGDPIPHAAVATACQSLPFLRRRLALAPPAYYPPLAALFAVVDDAMPPIGDQARLLLAVEWLLEPLPTSPDTLLFIDDAHNLTAASLDLLARLAGRVTVFLVGRVSGWTSVVMSALRAGDASKLASLSRPRDDSRQRGPTRQGASRPYAAAQHDGKPQWHAALPSAGVAKVAHHTLRPLATADVTDLVDRLAQRDLPALAKQIADQTGGVPLHVIATLQNLFEEGILYVDAGGQWATTGASLPSLAPTLQAALEA